MRAVDDTLMVDPNEDEPEQEVVEDPSLLGMRAVDDTLMVDPNEDEPEEGGLGDGKVQGHDGAKEHGVIERRRKSGGRSDRLSVVLDQGTQATHDQDV